MFAYQLWSFVRPGLHRHERRPITPLMLGTMGLFAAGVVLCHDFVLPRAFEFLLEYSPGTMGEFRWLARL